jgi:hypothetical protein
MNGNGHTGSTMNGNQAPISISGHSYSNYSSTLPHLGGHLSTHHFAALNTPGLGNGGGCLSGNGGLNHQVKYIRKLRAAIKLCNKNQWVFIGFKP